MNLVLYIWVGNIQYQMVHEKYLFFFGFCNIFFKTHFTTYYFTHTHTHSHRSNKYFYQVVSGFP